MVLASPADPTRPARVHAPVLRALRRPRRWDIAPGAEVVGACQLLLAWGLLVATQEASPAGFLVMLGVGSVAAVALGFLHGLLLVKPLALLGRLTARLTAWPEPVAVLVLLVPVSAPPALMAHGWLRDHVASAPGFGAVWACTVASAVLPMVAGACLRARPVPLKALWGRGLTVTAAAVAVLTMAGFVMDLGV
ncbi:MULTISPECIES: hypothetical protein [unclassified Streptomyces]|uniref:hypothetical protein n=1 Tax=unclassified Streptomyces TaxID=2593676 RepID=UPI00224F5460|nr:MULTISPECIES: hypothetical protein [unclassified Streptomyces]MCX5148934.1 hypothetical protein [Streptomyces sp. NBC_00320]WSN51987.1 hypothetical protein OG299_32025 [Streptomyces sp. NBC_01296]